MDISGPTWEKYEAWSSGRVFVPYPEQEWTELPPDRDAVTSSRWHCEPYSVVLSPDTRDESHFVMKALYKSRQLLNSDLESEVRINKTTLLVESKMSHWQVKAFVEGAARLYVVEQICEFSAFDQEFEFPTPDLIALD